MHPAEVKKIMDRGAKDALQTVICRCLEGARGRVNQAANNIERSPEHFLAYLGDAKKDIAEAEELFEQFKKLP